jgi:hypothetical protein
MRRSWWSGEMQRRSSLASVIPAFPFVDHDEKFMFVGKKQSTRRISQHLNVGCAREMRV